MEDLQNTIKQGESKHRTHLFLFRWGEKIQHSGELAWPLLDKDEKPIRTIWSCGVRLTFLGCLIMGFSQLNLWWLGLVIYAVFHLVLFLVGSLMVSQNKKILDKLDEEFDELWYAYLNKKAKENDITIAYPCDACYYADNITVQNNGLVRMPTSQDFGTIRIFRNNEYRDGEARDSYKESYAGGQALWLKDQVASVEFKKKFQVATSYDNEERCVRYLSPSTVVGFIRNPEIDNFREITIENGALIALSDYGVERPDSVDMYKFRPIGWYFKDIDKYVVQLKKNCDEAHRGLMALKALRGPEL